MAFEVVMPRLGWNMETGQLVAWLKQDGQRVEAGEVLFTVEGDKATQEVEALESGTLRIPPYSPPPGKDVPVGTVLAYLLEEGEAAPFDAGNRPTTGEQARSEPRNEPIGELAGEPARTTTDLRRDQLGASAGAVLEEARGTPAISPRAKRIARELGVDWTGLQGSGRTGRIVERDVRQAAAAARAPSAVAERVSPLARRLADELGVDVRALGARMPGKRIMREDVEAEAERLKADKARVGTTAPPEPATTPFPMPAGAVLPITAMRRITADRMAASAHTTAAVTLTTEVDATELVRLRKQLQSDPTQPLPTYNDLLAKLAAEALLEHPHINARFEGETIVQSTTVNVGLAVDTDRGLLVPVLRDVQGKSLRQIARESAPLIEAARSGQISADELHGGTFTITNLGMYEIDAFSPIINLPECAILGVGRIVPKQVVMDAEAEQVAIRHMMFLSLTFDHRLVDGAPAARFLQRVKQYVEQPYLWLAR